ncbi:MULTISPECIES: LysM-like peptidoglycan-binding domain-containing protein [Oceanisphaera]|uniref:LysM-like peptidoglycan-binding domain-containing protein n=1 Tax=Oceanisphaera ostreae TaxID=914151 RepID=A0ABW3KG44_9GAMM
MKRNKPQSFASKINALSLPARQSIGRGLQGWQRVPKIHKAGLLLLIPLWLLLFTWQPAPKQAPVPMSGSLSLSLAPAVTRDIPVPDGGKRIDHTLAQGETLAALFRKWQLPGGDLIALIRAEPSYKPLSNLRAGQELTAVINTDGHLHYLEVNDKGLLLNAFRRMGQEFSVVTTP